MKKQILTFFMALFVMTSFAQIDTIVSKTPGKKKVLIEEFTGTNCPACPLAHKVNKAVVDANPGNAFMIAIHQGDFSGSNPDFKTAIGNTLAGIFPITGWPSTYMNRHIFPGSTPNNKPTQLPYGAPNMETDYKTRATNILGENSPVNIAIKTNIDYATRKLEVICQVYYTATETAINRLNVAILQNNIKGPQSGSASNPTYVTPDGQYIQMHMLRDYLTGQWGVEIPTKTAGTFWDSTFTYTIPEKLGLGNIPVVMPNLEVVAFIAQDKIEILTAAAAKMPIPNYPIGDLSSFDWNAGCLIGIGQTKTSTPFTLKNIGGGTLKITEVTGLSAPFTCSVDLSTLTVDSAQSKTFTFTYNPTALGIHNQTVNIKTDGGNFTIKLKGAIVDCATEIVAPWTETFDYFPGCWTKANPNGGTGWAQIEKGITPLPGWTGGTFNTPTDGGNNAAYCTWITGGTSSNDQWLISPQITLSNNMELSFYLYKFNEFKDALSVKISTTGKNISDFTTTLLDLQLPTTLKDKWEKHIVSLSAYDGKKVYIAFNEKIANNEVDGDFLALDLVKIDVSSGVESNSTANISIYPNPATDNFTIYNAANSNVEIYDVLSNKVAAYNNISNNQTISTSEFVEGTYIVKVINGEAISTQKVLVVK